VINPDPNRINADDQRPYHWQFGVSIDLELFRAMRVSAGYHRPGLGVQLDF